MIMSAVTLSLATELFPRGITQYLIGGLFVGLGIAVIYLGTGIIAGNSTFFETTLSYVSDLPRFQREQYVSSRDWRVIFAVSIVIGAALYGLVLTSGIFVTRVQWWRLLGGGILVGIGTRLGKGCTSGHGVSGIASLSRTSLVNTVLFVGVAILTALTVAALGVSP
ncbi:YeeE/YedE family protein [Haloterrigena sp. H1]|uniref:YeeE/YedE family protein n=1 Tax=Haloterrigena sp. H1 TaxID=2552943 RepID=UPI00110F5DA5|nr:YeeE/YedE family protein [Haloterrigena sp. H1]